MQTISDNYLGYLKLCHREKKNFGNQSAKWAFSVREICKKLNTADVLDYGCGNAKLANNLCFEIKSYDPAVEKYEDGREAADVVVCTNVLEMVEPDHIGQVLDDIRSLTNKVCFFVIATVRSKDCLPDGRNKHLTVNDANWWTAALTINFSIEMMQNHHHEVVILCRPLPKAEEQAADKVLLSPGIIVEDSKNENK